jgi:hypothetical protein
MLYLLHQTTQTTHKQGANMKRTLTQEQVIAKYGSIEKYEAYRAKVSVYRKKRRAEKRKPVNPIKKMIGAFLGLFI